jgi:hypothetical protein
MNLPLAKNSELAQIFGFKGSKVGFYAEDYVNGKMPSIKNIFDAYPNFRTLVKRGDVFSDVELGEERAEGSWMYDGKDLISLGFDADDYGHVSREFKAFTEFHPNHWNFDNLRHVKHGEKSDFNWHCSIQPVHCDHKLFDSGTFTDKGNIKYFVISAGNEKHVVYVDNVTLKWLSDKKEYIYVIESDLEPPPDVENVISITTIW